MKDRTSNKIPEPIRPRHDRRLPTRLSISSGLDALYADHGGPIRIYEMERCEFEFACSEFPFHRVQPILAEWTQDTISIRRHWPWLAYAASQYVYEQRERPKYREEEKPSEIRALINQIGSDAVSLSDALMRLHVLANRMHDPYAPDRREHLTWMHEFLVQGIARPGSEPDLDVVSRLKSWNDGHQLVQQLCCLRAGAEDLANRIDDDSLTREKGPHGGEEGLYNLVWRSGDIWQSLTGQPPSVHRIHPKPNRTDTRPRFVRFVSRIACLATNEEPTPAKIKTALKQSRPPHSAEKKSQ